jgi:Divergent InlB B-repeat domain/PASTA domain
MSSGELKEERGMTRFMHRPIWVAVAVAVIVVAAAAFKVSLAGATHVAPFVGNWENDNAATREQTRAVIGVNGENFEVWGYGACGGGECDWAARVGGPRTTPQSDATDGQLSIVWEFGFSRRAETLTLLPDGRLHNRSFTQYLDGSGRPDRWSDEYFHKTTAPAVFYTLVVRVAGAGRGKVTSSPAGLSCPAACSLEFQGDTSVALTATPERGSKLSAWSGACRGKAATCTIAVSGDLTATAVFAPNPPCVVPALKGRTLAGARRALTAAHCMLAAVKRAHSRRVRPGRVVSQAPAAGAKLRNGGRVSLVISRGPRR